MATLVVDAPFEACTPDVLRCLRALLETHPGNVPIMVRFRWSSGVTPIWLPMAADGCVGLMLALAELGFPADEISDA